MSKRLPVSISPSQLDQLARRFEGFLPHGAAQAVMRMEGVLSAMRRLIEVMALDFSKLVAAAEARKTVDDSIIAMVSALSTQLKDVSRQLFELRASGDLDTSGIQKQIDDMAASADAESQRLADAVKANTPAAGV